LARVKIMRGGEQMREGAELDDVIRRNLEALGYGE
jgi:hypothetical protein